MTTNIPCIPPHIMNVQPAPCQSPETKKVIRIGIKILKGIIFLNLKLLPLDFRANKIFTGKKMYCVKNELSVMCHLLQKSIIFVAL